MPSLDIEVYEFVQACSRYDIKELIKELVDNDHLPKDLYNDKGEVKKQIIRKTASEIEFGQKLDKLKEKFFSLTQDEEVSLQTILNKYT
jgi:hypothetical protein